jgi:F-type H+-transporting ATPase subunit a
MFPLNLISLLSRVLSMALRLFGNVIAGEIVGLTIFSLVPVLAPLVFYLLSMITGLLQALVFTVLTITFIADAMKLDD